MHQNWCSHFCYSRQKCIFTQKMFIKAFCVTKNEYLICFVTSSFSICFFFFLLFSVWRIFTIFFFRSVACSKTLMKCYYKYICCFDVLSIIIECIMHIEHFNIYYACRSKKGMATVLFLIYSDFTP